MFRMKPLSLSLMFALSAAGCAGFGDPAATSTWRVEPSPLMIRGALSADASYRAGRWYHALHRYDAAEAAYREALRLEPRHPAARNALGVLLSTQGRHEEAVRELQSAVTQSPNQAHLRNNLGYAHYLRGALSSALNEFESARRLDPSNRKVDDNLRLVRGRLAPRSDQRDPSPAPDATQPAPTPPATPNETESRIVLVAPNVYEMREPQPALPPETAAGRMTSPVAATLPAAIPAAMPVAGYRAEGMTPVALRAPAAGQRRARLEISNGNGLNGYARRVGIALSRLGWAGGRLTNALPYRQAATEIHYREGYAEEAIRLAASLKPGVLVIRDDALAAQVDMRLVLGRDAWSERALLRPAGGGDRDSRLVARR
jgi:tetratricopeptide (TPR) repeat protein